MSGANLELREFHWLTSMLQAIDVGITVLDREFRIQIWNAFMENHSGRRPESVQGRILFDCFPELPEQWLRRKVEPVFQLSSNAFSSWEQRPWLFRFRNYRPITGKEDLMYQNVTFMPLTSLTGEVDHLCILVYDVTDMAISRKAQQA